MTAAGSPRKKEEKSREDKINEIMADGATSVKMEVDYRSVKVLVALLRDLFNNFSETCDKKIPEAQTLAAEGKLDAAMEMLLGLEKQTRSGCDTHSTGRVLVTIVQLCFSAGDYTQLSEKIQDLVKKRSQLKQAVAKMIAECCTFIDK